MKKPGEGRAKVIAKDPENHSYLDNLAGAQFPQQTHSLRSRRADCAQHKVIAILVDKAVEPLAPIRQARFEGGDGMSAAAKKGPRTDETAQSVKPPDYKNTVHGECRHQTRFNSSPNSDERRSSRTSDGMSLETSKMRETGTRAEGKVGEGQPPATLQAGFEHEEKSGRGSGANGRCFRIVQSESTHVVRIPGMAESCEEEMRGLPLYLKDLRRGYVVPESISGYAVGGSHCVLSGANCGEIGRGAQYLKDERTVKDKGNKPKGAIAPPSGKITEEWLSNSQLARTKTKLGSTETEKNRKHGKISGWQETAVKLYGERNQQVEIDEHRQKCKILKNG
ncbi:hypothetical protein DFH08DRAFT_803969 [Mycena albidolilacea]|uniref:Uncharacterized protein n=1 Tax=Mycena albidolilacea TaxID=1033008 RepID=A0AAD7AB71_9AGAR|nr:hypothetical protein DFH08DRAFT_803969 [Mycena albidolilacea]